jgi:hypothetical protein
MFQGGHFRSESTARSKPGINSILTLQSKQASGDLTLFVIKILSKCVYFSEDDPDG